MRPDLLAAAARRRSGRRGDAAAGPLGVGPSAGPGTQGSSAGLLGQQVVRDVLAGSGLGALSPVLAAEMVLQAGGIDAGVLEADSNRQMQAMMQTVGGIAGQDPMAAVQGVMGGMPQVAQQVLGRGLGGPAPLLGASEMCQPPGLDPQQDLGAMFQMLTQLADGELEQLLSQVGGQVATALGAEGLQEVLGAMGVLLDEEQLGQGLQGLIPEALRQAAGQVLPALQQGPLPGGPPPPAPEQATEPVPEQIPAEPGAAEQEVAVEPGGEAPASTESTQPGQEQEQEQAEASERQEAAPQQGPMGEAGGGGAGAEAPSLAPPAGGLPQAPQQRSPIPAAPRAPTRSSGPPRQQPPASAPGGAPPRTQVRSPSAPPGLSPAGGGVGGAYANPIPNTAGMRAPQVDPEQAEQSGTQEHQIDLQMNLDLPPELQGGGGAEAPQYESDVSTPDVQANVGEGMVPQNDYTANDGQASGVAAGPSGDALTESGTDPAAGAARVSVSPDAGTEAGLGAASGGESVAPEVQEGLNPAADQELAQQPEHQAETPTAPGTGPEMGAIEAAGGGGGGDLPSANIDSVGYSAGGQNLPAPDAPDAPRSFASGGSSQAGSQMQQDASQLDSVQPQVDGQIAGEVDPLQEEGNQGILDTIRSFFESLGLFDSQAATAEQSAQTRQAEAQANTQALIADAQAQQQAQLAQQAGLPVPAELSQRGETYMQAVTEAEANAVAVWTGGPQTQMPTGATAAMDGASADLSQLQGAAIRPDLQDTVGAVQLPDHGLDPQSFSEVVPAGQQQLDPSVIPQQPTPFPGSSGGGDAIGQVQAEVDAQVSSEITAYQQQVIQEQTQRAASGYDGMISSTEASYQGSVDNAQAAIAEYDAVDIGGEVAPFEARAQAAFADAQSQADAALSTMDGAFATEQGSFDSAIAAAQGTFQGSVTDAQGQHGVAVSQAGTQYDTAVGQAQTELQTGHNEALGTYQNAATAAQQGAQQTFDAEHQAAQGALQRHRAGFDAQYQAHQSSADQVGGQAESLFQTEFSAHQARLDAQTQQAISQTQGRIDSEMSSGQGEIDRLLADGQSQAQAELDAGQQRAQAERDAAQREADRRLAEAENQDRNILQKVGDAIASAVSAALDWVRARFEQARNAIVGILEAARDAAQALLDAARDAALAVLDRVRGLIQGLIDALADVLRTLISAAAAFLQSLIQFVVGWISAQIQAITALINGLIEAFQAIVNAVFEGLVAAVALIDADLAAKLDQAASAFLDRFNSLCDTAQSAISSASQALQDQIQAAGDALQSAVQAAEETLNAAVDTAEAALHAGVDLAYNAAVTAVNTAYEVATDVVNATFDLARDAVVAVIDAAYSVIEAAATELAERIQEVFHALGVVAEWVTQNIVGPVLDFLADPWTGLRQMWVGFWNSPWRDVLLGVALAALATAVVVATGGLGLVAMVAITAAVTGATAAATYGAGEMAARRANVSLVQEGHQTWNGASMVDPATGQMVPDPRDPQNAWYLDTLGSISSNPDGSMSYVGSDGELVTLTPDQLANDPSAVLAMMEYGLERGEDGTLSGESMGDSLRGSAAIAADKGIEWTVNGAVTAGTMGLGNGLTAAREAGRIGTVAMNTARIGGGAAMSATGDLISAPVSDAVGEMISDGRSFDEAFDMAWQHDSVGDVAVAWGTSFATNAVGDLIGDSMGGLGRNEAGTGWADTSFLGRTTVDAASGVAKSASGMVIQNASDVMFDGDPETGWGEFWERSTRHDAIDRIIEGTVENVLSSRADKFAERYGEQLHPGIDRAFGAPGVLALEQAVQQHTPELEQAGIPLDRQGLPAPVAEVRAPEAGPAMPPPPPIEAALALPRAVERTGGTDVDGVLRGNADPRALVAGTDDRVATASPEELRRVDPRNQGPSLDGNASRIHQDSRFHGDNSADQLGFRGIYNGIRRMRTNLGEGDGLTFQSQREDGHYRADLQVRGRDVAVRIEIADLSNAETRQRFSNHESGTDAARLRRNEDGSWTVELSGNLSEADVSRALAHELAEIRFVEGSGGGQDSTAPGVLTRDGSPTGPMTAHDAGRVAELADLLGELDRHRPQDGQTSERFDALRSEIAVLMRETGLDQNNAAGRERLRVISDHRDLLPPAALPRLQTHMADQLSVDVGKVQQRVGEMARALFPGLDYVDGRQVLDSLAGMSQPEAGAFYDLVRDELGLSREDLHEQLTTRLRPTDRSEALAHLSGDRLQSAEAALQNLMGHEDFREQAHRDQVAADRAEGMTRVARSFLNIGSWAKDVMRGSGANHERALQLLANLDPVERNQLIQRNPQLMETLGERLRGNDQARWQALTAPMQDGQDPGEWNSRARAADLMLQIRDDLKIGDSWLTRTFASRDRERALRNVDRIASDPALYEAALQQVARDLPEGSEVSADQALAQLLTQGLGGRRIDTDRTEHEVAQVRARLERAALELQNRELKAFLGDVGLSTNTGDLQLLAARASENAELRRRLHDAIGADRTQELIDYATRQRALQITDQAHQVLAALDSGHYQELVSILREPSVGELRDRLLSRQMSAQDREVAHWMLGRFMDDRRALQAELARLTDGDLDQLLENIGDEQRRELVPRLLAGGTLPRGGEIALALGDGGNGAMLVGALQGLSPAAVQRAAADFRRRVRSDERYADLAGRHTDSVQFLEAVIRERLSGREQHDALLAVLGDGRAAYDPGRAYESDEVREARASERYQAERERLRRSFDYENEIGGAPEALQGGQPSTQDRLRESHARLDRFLQANEGKLQRGDREAWESLQRLRRGYDHAVRDHQMARSSSGQHVSKWVKTGTGLAATLTLTALTGGGALVPVGAGLAGTAAGVGTRFGMDRTLTHREISRDLLAGAASSAVPMLGIDVDLGGGLMDTAADRMLNGLASGTAESVVKRGFDFTNGRADDRRAAFGRALSLDMIKSSFTAGVGAAAGLTDIDSTGIDNFFAAPIESQSGDTLTSAVDGLAGRGGERRSVRDRQQGGSASGLGAESVLGSGDGLSEVARNRRRLGGQRRNQRRP